jgi:hypothetical protein
VTSSEKSYQIQGKGGVASGGNGMAYKMTLPPDFLYGIEPETIIDNSSTLDFFYKAIDIMASESQVLILINHIYNYSSSAYAYKNVYSQIVNKLEKDSYIVHPKGGKDGYYDPQNKKAGKWVRAHPPQIKKNMASCGGTQKKKYLIGDWYSSAGYEVPAVILVTQKLDDNRNATYCQRAKAKLVIYHAPNPRAYSKKNSCIVL